MTGRATGELDRCPNLILRCQLFADFVLVGRGLPVHIENLILRAKHLLGRAMAVDAPGHQQRVGLKDQGHLIDLAVAGGAPDALLI